MSLNRARAEQPAAEVAASVGSLVDPTALDHFVRRRRDAGADRPY